MVALRLAHAAATSVPGWKRSSWTRQPPVRIIAMVEYAIAFMCASGSGVIRRSRARRTRAQAADAGVPLAGAAGSSRWSSTQPFGRPVVPEV